MSRYPEQVATLIDLLQNMRKRRGMYMGKGSVEAAIPYLLGWRLALSPWLGEGLQRKDEIWVERGWPETTLPSAQHMLDAV